MTAAAVQSCSSEGAGGAPGSAAPVRGRHLDGPGGAHPGPDPPRVGEPAGGRGQHPRPWWGCELKPCARSSPSRKPPRRRPRASASSCTPPSSSSTRGNLGRAVTMFELADQLAMEQKVKRPSWSPLRKGGHEYLDPERLRQFGERRELRPGLRTILNFFVMLRPEGLLHELNGEPRRERRHQLLALLEAHGEAARAKAWELLKASVETPDAEVDPFFQMNLVYLLRVIPRPAALGRGRGQRGDAHAGARQPAAPGEAGHRLPRRPAPRQVGARPSSRTCASSRTWCCSRRPPCIPPRTSRPCWTGRASRWRATPRRGPGAP